MRCNLYLASKQKQKCTMKIFIVGCGNLASHLIPALKKAGHELVGISSGRRKSSIFLSRKYDIPYFPLDEKLPASDFILLLIPDDAISSVSKKLDPSNTSIQVHCSGASDISSLCGNKTGSAVMYPLQTFSSSKKPLDFKSIPLLIEGSDKKNLMAIKKLATTLSDSVHTLASSKRLALHLAAVFINNFSNHMAVVAHTICKHHAIPFAWLEPLMKQTAQNVFPNPEKSQTGPAKRNDMATIKKHKAILKDLLPEEGKLYLHLTNIILKNKPK